MISSDDILKYLLKYFWSPTTSENFLGNGNQTKIKISNITLKDIEKGKKILKTLSKFDVGQSVVMQNGNVIGIEALQGTDELIKNSYYYLDKNKKSVLIKMVKVKQNLKVDLPTIGIKTLKNCKKYSISGIAYSANKTLFLKKQKVKEFCYLNNIFLIGI